MIGLIRRKEKPDPNRIAELEAELGLSDKKSSSIASNSVTHASLGDIASLWKSSDIIEHPHSNECTDIIVHRISTKSYYVGSIIR